MTPEEHRLEHVRLHRAFDELLACYLSENAVGVRTSIHDEIFTLMKWSYAQTQTLPAEPVSPTLKGQSQ
jgi:hypothetical protein